MVHEEDLPRHHREELAEDVGLGIDRLLLLQLLPEEACNEVHEPPLHHREEEDGLDKVLSWAVVVNFVGDRRRRRCEANELLQQARVLLSPPKDGSVLRSVAEEDPAVIVSWGEGWDVQTMQEAS